MTTPEPGAPEPGLRLATAGPSASCDGGFGTGSGQGTSGYRNGMASSNTANEDEDQDEDMTPSSSPSSSSADTAEENRNNQHELHVRSVAGGPGSGGHTSVAEIDSNYEYMDIDENGDAYERQRIHTNRGNVERWLNGTYALGYGPPGNAQEEMQRFERDFGVWG